MSSTAAHRCRKRRHDDAHGGASPTTRRRRRLAHSPLPAVRSFGLRFALAGAPQRPRKRRHDESASCLARPRRQRGSRRLLSPSPFHAVRPFSLRVALTTSPRRRRELHVDTALHPVCNPRRRRRRSSSSPFSRARYFPRPRPLAFRFLLATRASATRRRRNPAAASMGNFISQLLGFGKTTSEGGLEEHSERLQGSPEVVDLTLEPDHEPEKVDVVRRGIGDWSVPVLESPTPPEKRPLEWTKRRDGRLQESRFEVFQELAHAELPGVLDNRSKEDLSELYTPLTDKDEREVNTLLYDSAPRTAGYDYQSVRRWTTSKKLGYGLVECDKIFIPVHRDIHWCLAVINMKDKTFQYLDSLGG
nr:unnamed protein product [Digitaria exilis]